MTEGKGPTIAPILTLDAFQHDGDDRVEHYSRMTRRFALLVAPLLFALTAAAPAPRTSEPLPDTVRVALDTDVGTIEIDLDAKHAPITSANFLRYVREKRFDGIVFYRVMRLAWGEQPNGLIQAGTRGDPRRNLPGVAHEPTSTTGIKHTAGAISMARWAPGTASGDFSILLSDLEGLDADPANADPERQAGFAAFGHVASGMDIVRRIYDAPLSPTKGEGVLKGQLLERPIRIVRARRVAN
jgi:peptidyl-prolyl cis-trans isomerase A (cyclophilin A)